MKLEQARPNVFRLTATSSELSALVAAARMAHEAMTEDPQAPAETVALLGRVIEDFDRSRERLPGTTGP